MNPFQGRGRASSAVVVADDERRILTMIDEKDAVVV